MDIETPEEFARKMSLVHDEVASDGTFDPPINKWSAMLTARDALIRADERQKAAERAREYLKTNNAYNGLYAAILAEPEPDVELLPDAEYGFVARYKSLTADGKTKDEAMQKLARVILAAFDLDSKWVPTAMLEEAYTRGYQDAFGNVKDMDYDTLAAKYGYHVE